MEYGKKHYHEEGENNYMCAITSAYIRPREGAVLSLEGSESRGSAGVQQQERKEERLPRAERKKKERRKRKESLREGNSLVSFKLSFD